MESQQVFLQTSCQVQSADNIYGVVSKFSLTLSLDLFLLVIFYFVPW